MSADDRNPNASADADMSACEAWLLQAETELSQWMLEQVLDRLERSHYELLGEISQYRSELTPLRSSAGPLLTHIIEGRRSPNSMNERNSDTVSLKDLQAYLNKKAKTSASDSFKERFTVDSDMTFRIEGLIAKVVSIVPGLSGQIPFEPVTDHRRDSASSEINQADQTAQWNIATPYLQSTAYQRPNSQPQLQMTTGMSIDDSLRVQPSGPCPRLHPPPVTCLPSRAPRT